ncbi:hypothetical protein V5799_024470, partial [Amblyomma americanum]
MNPPAGVKKKNGMAANSCLLVVVSCCALISCSRERVFDRVFRGETSTREPTAFTLLPLGAVFMSSMEAK